ncbi:SpaA isopeptide-forming pilin-related protein [Glutamicibacter ardleyensis]|uniref:SpaA isopeptide-forming pilin-related protein n=1 Tax=Glutamicibacter ardleyensis TaxID=225894 RepID=UPI003FD20395
MLGKHYEKHRTQKSNGTAKKSKSTQTVQRPKHQNASLQRGSRNTLVFCASLIALASLLLHGTGAAYATPPAPTSSLFEGPSTQAKPSPERSSIPEASASAQPSDSSPEEPSGSVDEPVPSEPVIDSSKAPVPSPSESDGDKPTTDPSPVPSSSEPEAEKSGPSSPKAKALNLAATYAPICRPGYVYGVTSAGQIRAVAPGGAVSNLGSRVAQADMEMNGLGIGAGGSTVFSYHRFSKAQGAMVYRFDVNTGSWTTTNALINSSADKVPAELVAGAVDLGTGRYYIGGYTPRGYTTRAFQIWEFNPTTNAIVYKGRITTDTASAAVANGDMGFDANGNLFVVRGSGSTATIYSVTAANLASANGGIITSSVSNTVNNTTTDVNGVAFDADGKGYLSSGDMVQSYDMPGWSNPKTVVSSNFGGSTDLRSTDLASCGSPPTITIEKFVEGGRVAASDQFGLSLRQGSANGTVIGTATTTGNANGQQPERIGPLPTVRNVELHFAESASGTTSLSNYASSYRCLVDGVQTVQGTGIAGKITIPSSGQSVECRFYNSPLIAQVNVHKQVTDSKGENPQPGKNWTVGATAQAITGTISSTPSAATQQTNTEGTSSWRFQFGASNNKADLKIREVMQDGYKFTGGKCEVTKLDGTKTTTTLTGPENNPAAGIIPGDIVDCTIVNSLKPASISIGKQLLDFNGENPKPASNWTVGAALATGSSSGTSISTPATALTGTNGKVATPWTLNFPNNPTATTNVTLSETMQTGYDFVSGVCLVTSDGGTKVERSLASVTSALTGIKPGDVANCTFTNKPKSGAVLWEKSDEAGEVLSGSQWMLTGPSNFNGGQPLAVQDCIAQEESSCTGADRNPEVGGFKLPGLTWGEYQLEETKAPAGYYPLEDPLVFEISADKLSLDLGLIENTRREGPAIPLTGGLGSDFYGLLGGGIIAVGLVSAAVLLLRKRHQGAL